MILLPACAGGYYSGSGVSLSSQRLPHAVVKDRCNPVLHTGTRNRSYFGLIAVCKCGWFLERGACGFFFRKENNSFLNLHTARILKKVLLKYIFLRRYKSVGIVDLYIRGKPRREGITPVDLSSLTSRSDCMVHHVTEA